MQQMRRGNVTPKSNKGAFRVQERDPRHREVTDPVTHTRFSLRGGINGFVLETQDHSRTQVLPQVAETMLTATEEVFLRMAFLRIRFRNAQAR